MEIRQDDIPAPTGSEEERKPAPAPAPKPEKTVSVEEFRRLQRQVKWLNLAIIGLAIGAFYNGITDYRTIEYKEKQSDAMSHLTKKVNDTVFQVKTNTTNIQKIDDWTQKAFIWGNNTTAAIQGIQEKQAGLGKTVAEVSQQMKDFLGTRMRITVTKHDGQPIVTVKKIDNKVNGKE